jgi:DNA-binding NtrC family response regulator
VEILLENLVKHLAKAKNKTLLLVDEDQSILKSYTRIFRKCGFEVDSAETGNGALEKLQTRAYDAALIERQFIDMDATALIAKMQPVAPKMVKIVLTGWFFPDDEPLMKALGAAAYLLKPVPPESLLSLLEDIEDKKHVEA